MAFNLISAIANLFSNENEESDTVSPGQAPSPSGANSQGTITGFNPNNQPQNFSAANNQGNIAGFNPATNEKIIFGPDVPSVIDPFGNIVEVNKAKPNIILTCDFVIENLNQGQLVVFETWQAAGYEIWRRDVLKNTEFQKIIALSSNFLKTERARFLTYVQQNLGLEQLNNFYAFLDTNVPRNTIVEYKIKLIQIPTSPREFKLTSLMPSLTVLASQTSLFSASFSSVSQFAAQTVGGTDIPGFIATLGNVNSSPTDDLAEFYLGNRDFGWFVGLLNRKIDYFATFPIIKQQILAQNNILLPTSPTFAFNIILHAINKFGLRATLEEVFLEMGSINNILANGFINSIRSDLTLDIEKFRQEITSASGNVVSLAFSNNILNLLVTVSNFPLDILTLTGFSRAMSTLQILSNSEPLLAGFGGGIF